MIPAEDFIRRVCEVVGDGPRALHEPTLGRMERERVDECLASGFVSSIGAFVTEFEQRLVDITGARFAVAVSSGTAALHLALLLVGVKPGDEVLLPSATFVATANAVSYCGALPHFVDIDRTTLGMDPNALSDRLNAIAEPGDDGPVNRQSGRRVAACIPVHTFGHPASMTALNDVAARWGLRTVEDAAEALGSERLGKHCGTFADIGTLSFNGNKIVTTGGGGALLTNDPMLAERARHLSTTAKVSHAWEFVHDEVGFNYRMPNLNAALGCAQLERLPAMLASKRQLTEAYMDAFSECDLGTVFLEPPQTRSNYWLQSFLLSSPDAVARDSLLEAAHTVGLLLRPMWQPLHTLKPYATMQRAPLPVTEELADSLINLPSSPCLV